MGNGKWIIAAVIVLAAVLFLHDYLSRSDAEAEFMENCVADLDAYDARTRTYGTSEADHQNNVERCQYELDNR